MYEAFFGLRERPFELAPNPRFLLLTARHSEALSNLEYGITGRKGLTLLLGEAGTGKTTVIRTALQKWEAASHLVAYINNPTLTRSEFVECLAHSFGLPAQVAASKTRLLGALTELVMRRHGEGRITGLLIDEAQSLSDELLEEVRLLANIETASEKTFPVVLAGQPELAQRLNATGLRQLKQRIGLRCVLSPLDMRETGAYVAGRIRLAGGLGGQLFTREAVIAIHEHARGIPRVINVICDNVLLSAFAANCRPATREMVEEVCRDFELDAEFQSSANRSDAAPTVRSPDLIRPDASASRPTVSVFESAHRRSAPEPENTSDRAGLLDRGGLVRRYLSKRSFSLFG